MAWLAVTASLKGPICRTEMKQRRSSLRQWLRQASRRPLTADSPQRFSVTFPLETVQEGEFASFSGAEKARVAERFVGLEECVETFQQRT